MKTCLLPNPLNRLYYADWSDEWHDILHCWNEHVRVFVSDAAYQHGQRHGAHNNGTLHGTLLHCLRAGGCEKFCVGLRLDHVGDAPEACGQQNWKNSAGTKIWAIGSHPNYLERAIEAQGYVVAYLWGGNLHLATPDAIRSFINENIKHILEAECSKIMIALMTAISQEHFRWPHHRSRSVGRGANTGPFWNRIQKSDDKHWPRVILNLRYQFRSLLFPR